MSGGTPIAASILRAGFELGVHFIHRDNTAPLSARGAVWADSTAKVAT